MRSLLEELAALELPPGDYAIFGSGPMCVRGLRQAQDLDIIVSVGLWNELINSYSAEEHEHGLLRIRIGNIEIYNGWYPNVGSVEDLIRDAQVIEGIRFVELKKVLEWKRRFGRQKDRVDIEIIEGFLGLS